MIQLTFTTWARLEPNASDPDMSPGLVAEVADPLWFLARQWQLGELQGEDAATPATVHVSAEVGVPNRARFGGGGPVAAYDPTTTPLDLLAEREPAPAGVPVVLAAEASLMLAEELGTGAAATAVLDALRVAFPLPVLTPAETAELAPSSAELLVALDGTAFDGVAVVRAQPADVPAAAAGPALDAAIAAVGPWVDLHLAPTSAWVPDQLGATVELGIPATGGQVALRAERPAGEQLGWWSFDRTNAALGAGTTVTALATHPLPATTVPMAGAPAARYWEMEDAAVDLGAVGVAPSELARLVVLEYLLVYGNDMVVVPLEVPYGCRVAVTKVEVVDNFGGRTVVPTAASLTGGQFRMWSVTGDDGALLVPPLALTTLNGPALEEVLVARDEQANVAWLIESLGTDPAGSPVDLRGLPAPAPPPPSIPDAYGTPRPPWRWKLTDAVPPTWHPLLPTAATDGRTRLVAGTVAGVPAAPPRSRLLAELPAQGLPLAIVPAEGLRLRRRAEATRWIDGSRHAWIARDRRAGTGDAGSGMVFDTLTKPDD
ncbi:MAG: hypothetical protein AB7L84_00145 [Acidimicrobiia bacterium]